MLLMLRANNYKFTSTEPLETSDTHTEPSFWISRYNQYNNLLLLFIIIYIILYQINIFAFHLIHIFVKYCFSMFWNRLSN